VHDDIAGANFLSDFHIGGNVTMKVGRASGGEGGQDFREPKPVPQNALF
jgi:hypothetical protein